MKKSKFNLSETLLMTGEMGKLIPIYNREMLPNDTFLVNINSIHKTQPMIAPLMHQIDVMTQWYFVPTRLLWSGWTEFITGGEDGTAEPEYPTMITDETKGAEINTLEDYLGIPTEQPGLEYGALQIRAYNKIWNDHYKIDDIDEEIEISYEDGRDTTTPKNILDCNWARDRFTKAKPFTQRGNQIHVPIVTTNTEGKQYVIYDCSFEITENTTTEPTTGEYATHLGTCIINANETYSFEKANIQAIANGTKGYIKITSNVNNKQPSGTKYNTEEIPSQTWYTTGTITINSMSYSNTAEKTISANFEETYVKKKYGSYASEFNVWKYFKSTLAITKLKFTLNATTTTLNQGINIRDLRIASALQRYQERSLKYGAEYEDYCKMEFGIKPRDSRLQKSEYLGGTKSTLQVSGIFQTTDTTDTPLGQEAGTGVAGLKQRFIRYRAPEHGIIMCLLSYRPKTLYTQGLKREFLRRNRYDYYTRELQDIGAEEIYAQEIYATKDNANTVFGYDLQGNYRDYKTATNRICGNFKTDMNFYHLGRFFESQPLLNSSFMKMKPRKDIFAITDQTLPAFYAILNIGVIAYRPMPRKSKNLLK